MKTGGFSKADRVRRREDFRRVFRGQAFAADQHLVLRGCLNEAGRPRLGLTLSRKVGNAVVRNRWKRVIREAFRRTRDQFPFPLDIVARPKKGAVPDFHALVESLPALVRRLHRHASRDASRNTP